MTSIAIDPRVRRSTRSFKLSEVTHAWLLMSPAVLLMLLMLLLPAASIIIVAFSDWQLGNSAFNFVGLNNFRELVADPVFWISLRNTLVYALTVVPLSMALGLGIAILIDSNPSWRGFYSTIFFLPFTASLVAMALVWQILLHPSIGPINAFLGELGLPALDFLHSPRLALPTLSVIGIWQLTGYAMLLNLAGLRSISPELYQAAEMDGATSAWARFVLVTWPQLGPTTLFILVIATMTALQVFETVTVLTQGEPGKATEVLMYTIYNEGFVFLRTNYAAALMCVFLLVLGVAIPLKIKLLDRKVHYS